MFDTRPHRIRTTVARFGERMLSVTAIAVVALIALAIVSPVQLQVVLYKLALVLIAFVFAYWLDRAMFPGYRPTTTDTAWLTIASMLRRALIVLAVVLGMTLGL